MTQFAEEQYEYLDIESITLIKYPVKMIDIEVEDDHTFCITPERIISHNCNNMVKSITIPALRTDCAMIIVNHTYASVGSMFAPTIKAQGGGKGVQYMARITLQCTRSFDKADDKKNKHYKGTVLKFMTVKNSIVKPFFKTEMYLDFAKGPNKYFGLFEPAKALGFITTPKVGYFNVPTFSDKNMRAKELFKNDEIWESFLPAFNEACIKDMAYSSGEEDLSDEALEEAMNDVEEANKEEVESNEN